MENELKQELINDVLSVKDSDLTDFSSSIRKHEMNKSVTFQKDGYTITITKYKYDLPMASGLVSATAQL